MAEVELWTDGCAEPNPGPGGWGIVAVRNGQYREQSGSLEHITNNRAELVAILKGLQILTQPGDEITIHTDSRYCIGVLSRGWRAVANRDLIWAVVQASMDRKVRYVWIGSKDNWKADSLSHGVSGCSREARVVRITGSEVPGAGVVEGCSTRWDGNSEAPEDTTITSSG